MLRVLRMLVRVLAFVLGTMAACAFVVHIGLYASTFLVPQLPRMDGNFALKLVIAFPVALFLLAGFLGAGCNVTVAKNPSQVTEKKAIHRIGEKVLLVVFFFVMINMGVVMVRTNGVGNNNLPEPGRWAWHRNGKDYRVLTPQEHEWYDRQLIRFYTGFGIGESLIAALIFFGQMPRNQSPANSQKDVTEKQSNG